MISIKPKALPDLDTRVAPIVAAVEPQTAHRTADAAARLARKRGAPLVFVTVRPPLPAVLDEPRYGRRLTRDLFRSLKTLDTALAAASRHGVMSYGDIVEGDAATEIAEFARARNAQLLVVGTRRAAARQPPPPAGRRAPGSERRRSDPSRHCRETQL